MKSVTAALREVLAEVGMTSDEHAYSDPRKPANLTPGYKAVGVKMSGPCPTDTQIQAIINKMTERGYHSHYIKTQPDPHWPDTRYCFSAPEYPSAVCAVD